MGIVYNGYFRVNIFPIYIIRVTCTLDYGTDLGQYSANYQSTIIWQGSGPNTRLIAMSNISFNFLSSR